MEDESILKKKIEEEILKQILMEEEILHIFYGLFKNLSNKTKVIKKFNNKSITISRVGLTIRERFYQKSRRIESVYELKQILNKIKDKINLNDEKNKLFNIWTKEITKLSTIQNNNQLKWAIKRCEVIPIGDINVEITFYYYNKELYWLTIKLLKEKEIMKADKQIKKKILAFLMDYYHKQKEYTQQLSDFLETIKNKCAKWLILEKIGEV